jgi:hypothetical protein
LFQGVKAYGIDYRLIQEPNSQPYYPLFMITSTKKNLDSVSIECMQLHHLNHPTSDIFTMIGWFDDTIHEDGTEGLFYFPDADPIIIAPPPEEDEESIGDGDVNDDGVTNILDVVQIVNYILGDLEFTDEQISHGDMNDDKGLNVLDIIQIVTLITDG